MSKKLKIFLISFLVSIPLWFGANVSESKLENFFFSQLYIETPRLFAAQLISQPKPVEITEPIAEIQAKAAFSLRTNEEGIWDIIYQKNIKQKLPIASLTKLMTALVVLDDYQLNLPITITKDAVAQEEDLGQLKIGETLTVENLFYIMLIESSNDAAYALSEAIGVDNFVDIMNWQAKTLGLKNTHFTNPTGLDDSQNYSTAQDLAILIKDLLQKPFIWEISKISKFDLYLADGTFHHQLKNTNQLLGEIPDIIGGKTGWTSQAQGCFILVLQKDNDYIINVVLGAEDRFAEMRKLINYSIQ